MLWPWWSRVPVPDLSSVPLSQYAGDTHVWVRLAVAPQLTGQALPGQRTCTCIGLLWSAGITTPFRPPLPRRSAPVFEPVLQLRRLYVQEQPSLCMQGAQQDVLPAMQASFGMLRESAVNVCFSSSVSIL